MKLKERIRGYLPVVVDVETAGFDNSKDALLEICAVLLDIDESGKFFQTETIHFHIEPFRGANINAASLDFNGIDIYSSFRMAVSEKQALKEIFAKINNELNKKECTKAILVGHNAFFDLGFLNAATKRVKIKSPFHQFSTLDTVTLSALYYGETVLAKAIAKAGIEWRESEAHSALYDTIKTSELFCKILNEKKFRL